MNVANFPTLFILNFNKKKMLLLINKKLRNNMIIQIKMILWKWLNT